MLYDNHICKLHSQNFQAMQLEYMQSSLTGTNISILMPLRSMFVKNPQMTMQFANEAYKEFITRSVCAQSDYQNIYEILATYGVTMSNFFIAVNKKTDKNALYTSSYSLLRMLASKGLIIQKVPEIPLSAELDKISEMLGTADTLKKTIRANKNQIMSVRLDALKEDGTVRFTMAVPRTKLVLGEDIIVPLQAMTAAMEYIHKILQERILRVTSGDKVRYVTFNYQLLSAIYGENRANYLISHMFDARTNSFYAPSMGASVYSSGVTNLDLFKIDKIDLMPSMKGIDLSDIYTDKSIAKVYLRDKVFTLQDSDLYVLALAIKPDKANLTKNDCIEILLYWLNSAYDDEVYNVVKSGAFSFLNAQEMSTMASKYGSLYEQERVPATIKDFYTLMSTGVFRIIIESRKGKSKSVTCTTSATELTRMYGEGYLKTFESEGVRLKAAKRSLLLCPDTITLAELGRFSYEFRIHLDLEAEDAFGTRECYKKEDILALVTVNEQQLLERTTVIKQRDLATVRLCDAYIDENGSVVDYYSQIDLSAIRSIIRLSIV